MSSPARQPVRKEHARPKKSDFYKGQSTDRRYEKQPKCSITQKCINVGNMKCKNKSKYPVTVKSIDTGKRMNRGEDP